MKLPLPVRPTGRRPQNENRVPLKIMRPLRLRDFVSGSGGQGGNVACLQEMSIMMACFKTNEFVEASCLKEISSFQKCVTDNKKEWAAQEEQAKKGNIAGAKKLNHLQVNEILKKYPS